MEPEKAKQKLRDKLHGEAQILFKLRHESIVALYDVVDEGDKIYIVMELVEGGELLDFCLPPKRLSESEAKFIFIRLIKALQYIHKKNIVHRDLKVQNILVDIKGSRKGFLEVKISDFGYSKLLDEGYSIAQTVVGTKFYMAPEVDENGYDRRVDVWSLGVVLYVMFEGNLPFATEDEYRKATINFKDNDRPSPEARDLIHSLIRVDPKERIELKECEKHPWVTGHGHARLVVDALQVDQDDEEKIDLPDGEPREGYEELRRDLTRFTNTHMFAACPEVNRKGKRKVVVNWRRAVPTTEKQVEEARNELALLLKYHFDNFRMAPRGSTPVYISSQHNPQEVVQSLIVENASTNQSPNNGSLHGGKPSGGKPSGRKSTRPGTDKPIMTNLRVHPVHGAGLDLEPCEDEGMMVKNVEKFPGQPLIKVGDVICSIGKASLQLKSMDEIPEVFGEHFCDGVTVELRRARP
jgi:serine/threonine protein kinase